jgi:hypothetical protein
VDRYNYSSRLYNKFLKILNDPSITNKLCIDMSELVIDYDRGKVYDFYVDYIKYHTDYKNIKDEYINYRSYGNGTKKEKFIIRFGEDEGIKRWEHYINKQSVTNTFEYKKTKYGWSQEDFDAYNKSRSVTRENLIKRHGYEDGILKWNNYVKKQQKAGCSVDYFQEKYGPEKGLEFYKTVNKKKVLNLNNFILKYGEEIGKEKFTNYISKKQLDKRRVSRSSQKFFNILLENISEKYHDSMYYHDKNYEYFFANRQMNGIYFSDFYDIKNNKIIEYNGDYYHANPRKYKADYYNHKCQMFAKDIWIRDETRISNLRKFFGVDVLVIWEYDIKNNLDEVIKKCIEFLNYENTD